MKFTSAVAAGALLGSASAGGVHKMKLKKVPLSEQFVSGKQTKKSSICISSNTVDRSTRTSVNTLALLARSTLVLTHKTPSRTPDSRRIRITLSQ